MKTAVILVNVGTPDKPEVKQVRRFLSEFLNDKRVIDIPWLLRKILVNLIIVPFRAPKSTKVYKLLWGVNSSPLLHYSNGLAEKLQKKVPAKTTVFNVMRYGNPSLKKLLDKLEGSEYKKLVVLPMFPQYASSTSGTVVEFVMNHIKKWNTIPEVKFVSQFYNNKGFIDAFAERAHEVNHTDYKHVIFSYHGLPLRQIKKCHPEVDCCSCNCENEMPEHGQYCYKATCYETSRLLAKQLDIPKSNYSVSFQSRLSKNWLEPFSDKVVIEKAQQGVDKLLVFAPAFVADCLETEVEIGVEYAEIFKENGGKELKMVPSLNDSDKWVDVVYELIKS